MGKSLLTIAVSLFAYLLLIGPFTGYMKSKPFVEKLGYIPSVKVLKPISADHKELTAAYLVMKVVIYFGGLIEKMENEMQVPADYPAMSRLIHNVVQLDPYNMDAYYFAQGILVWDIGKVDIANELLDYGMRYRTWDWYLPYFAGFNNAFFLKDYDAAARYFRRAGELSGSPLYKSLAGRYMQESGRTDLAISYLLAMEKQERNPAVKKSYQLRIAAFREVRRVETALDKYRQETGEVPANIDALLRSGFLGRPPVDPYGGTFYLDQEGKVATTSKFAFMKKKDNNTKNNIDHRKR